MKMQTKPQPLRPELVAGIFHHEIGNLLVYCMLAASSLAALVLILVFCGGQPRVFAVPGVKKPIEAPVYYGPGAAAVGGSRR